MLVCDYHTHPQGHRMQPYTLELLQPWADSARKIGLSDIAFTDHDRYHAGIDFDEIDRLRDNNVDLKIRAGIELDNDPVHSNAGRKWVEQHWNQLDFVLGSVHFLIATIRCSTASRLAPSNSTDAILMEFTPITFAASAK